MMSLATETAFREEKINSNYDKPAIISIVFHRDTPHAVIAMNTNKYFYKFIVNFYQSDFYSLS